MFVLGDVDEMVMALAVGGGVAIVLVAIVFGTFKSILQKRAFEQSRREIAAYVAEGSISAADAQCLLAATDTAKDAEEA